MHVSGRDFAIARISDGTANPDPTFATNWAGIKAAGMVRGAYQFFEPGDDPTAQANLVVSAVGKLGDGDSPVTADMEVTGGESAATIAAHLQTWVAAVQAGTGKAPMIYTAPGYWDASVGSTAFGNLPLWGADWGVTCPTLATGWTEWKAWQYADNGTVGGISGNVDSDEFNGDLTALQTFAGGGADWGAQYVSQSWPLATMTMTMTVNQALPASLTLKNIGAKAWDTSTKIGTTQPRDRTSPFYASDWLAPNRLAGVTGTVAPGADYDFKFTFQAPNTPGMYDEFYGVVQEGVAWFSDPGQGGPVDSHREVQIKVVAGPVSDKDAGATGGKGRTGARPGVLRPAKTTAVALPRSTMRGRSSRPRGTPTAPGARPAAGRRATAPGGGDDAGGRRGGGMRRCSHIG